jgi:Heterokaryon incompatibility protein (HET)
MTKPSLYTSLPSARSIRLLRLHPEADDERIFCSLEVIEDFAYSPQYQALSYCWGAKNDLTELSCNGEASTVTKNLYAALYRMRQKEKSILVWADAMCINQDDIPERNQQVSIMAKIYRHASRVCIWTGPGNEDSLEVIAMIQNITHRIHQSCDAGGQ